jgi:hypothetical protein
VADPTLNSNALVSQPKLDDLGPKSLATPKFPGKANSRNGRIRLATHRPLHAAFMAVLEGDPGLRAIEIAPTHVRHRCKGIADKTPRRIPEHPPRLTHQRQDYGESPSDIADRGRSYLEAGKLRCGHR